jgi:GT2 family glycosyltransferase
LEKLVVVDNASKENPIGQIEVEGLPIEIIMNDVNLGFAAACNMGAKDAAVDYLLFLNPDTQLFPDSLDKPIAFMEHPESASIGICGIRLIDDIGNTATSAARFPTLSVFASSTLRLDRVLPNFFLSHLMDSEELNESKTVDQVIGAFFLIRKGVFDLCEGFDERFFVYFEEVDLSLRAKNLGYSSYFLSGVRAFHKGCGCSDRVKATRLFFSLRSRLLYAQKHYSMITYVLLIMLTAVELPLRLFQSIIRRSWDDAQNTLIAYRQLTGYFLRNSFRNDS